MKNFGKKDKKTGINLDRITDTVEPPKLRPCHFQVPRIDDPSINSASVPTLIKLRLRRKNS